MDEESCRRERTACAGVLGDRGHGFEQARPGPGTAAHPGSFERPVASEGRGEIPAWAVQPHWGDQSNNQPRRYARPCSGSALRTDDSRPIALYRVPEIVTRGRFPDGGESDSTWRTQEARHVGSDTIAPGF